MATDDVDYEDFLNHHLTQLNCSGILEVHRKTLFDKLKNEVFDASDYFTFVYNGDGKLHPVVSREEGLKRDDSQSIFLIDHAWTFEAEYAREQLRTIPGLAKRIAGLMDLVFDDEQSSVIDKDNGKNLELERSENKDDEIISNDGCYTNDKGEELPKENVVEQIFSTMWKYNKTYTVKVMSNGTNLSELNEQICFWYIMDEFGSRIRHSDHPSVSIKCFYYANSGISYSVMFLNKDLSYGDIITQDFAAGVDNAVVRATILYPWQPENFSFDPTIEKKDIDDILFHNETRCQETFKEEPEGIVYLPKKETYNVYTDIGNVAKSLKAPKYCLVEDISQADILWMKEHYKDYKSLQEDGRQYINQFPFENIITCKDLLARVVNRVGVLYPERCDHSCTKRPIWFQESYNLNFELARFIHDFRLRHKSNQDNTWIIKPWNLGRSLDTHVTNNLNQIIRLRETGPKIAFKYIHNPVLFQREDVGKVKFHFRYMAAVTSINPLLIHVDKVFWIGCANRPFSMDNFDVYEKHFTTMNYRKDVTFKQVHYNEFPAMFDNQYPGYRWHSIETEVHQIIKELFEAASFENPPRGMGHCKLSRAYYAMDFMLKWADDGSKMMQPVLLEVNFNPDCNRLVQYHPDSFHHLFSILFLGEKTPWPCVRL